MKKAYAVLKIFNDSRVHLTIPDNAYTKEIKMSPRAYSEITNRQTGDAERIMILNFLSEHGLNLVCTEPIIGGGQKHFLALDNTIDYQKLEDELTW